MPILHSHRLIFVHVPRTAGTSIEKSLGICGNDNQGSNELNPSILFGFDGTNFLQHLYATEIRSRIGSEMFHSYFKFAFIRNPFARLLSVYHNHFSKYATFDKFVRRIVPKHLRMSLKDDDARHIKPQWEFLYDTSGNCLVDFIGRQEQLKRDLAQCSTLAHFDIHIDDSHRPRAADYRSEFSDRQRRLAELYYERDCELFGYSYDEAFAGVA